MAVCELLALVRALPAKEPKGFEALRGLHASRSSVAGAIRGQTFPACEWQYCQGNNAMMLCAGRYWLLALCPQAALCRCWNCLACADQALLLASMPRLQPYQRCTCGHCYLITVYFRHPISSHHHAAAFNAALAHLSKAPRPCGAPRTLACHFLISCGSGGSR